MLKKLKFKNRGFQEAPYYTTTIAFSGKGRICRSLYRTKCASEIKSWGSSHVIMYIPNTQYPFTVSSGSLLRYKGITVKKIQRWLDFLSKCGINAKIAWEAPFEYTETRTTYEKLIRKYGVPVYVDATHIPKGNYSSRTLMAYIEAIRYVYSPEFRRADLAIELHEKYSLKPMDALLLSTCDYLNRYVGKDIYSYHCLSGDSFNIPRSNASELIHDLGRGGIHAGLNISLFSYPEQINNVRDYYERSKLIKEHNQKIDPIHNRLITLAKTNRHEFIKEIFKLREEYENK